MVYLQINKKNYASGKSKLIDKLNKHLTHRDDKIFILFYMEGCGPCNATRTECYKIKNFLSNHFLNRDDIVIVEPGTGYTNNDTIINASTIGITTSPISYKIQVGSNGDIAKVLPINSQLNNVLEVEDLPVLKVISATGYGATLKAKLKPRKQYQGEVKQQIDCIGK